MSSSAPERSNGATPSEIQIFRQSARIVQTVVKRNFEEFTQAESLLAPGPAGNCANWVLGHLLLTYNRALPVVNQTPVMPEGALARYERGSDGITKGAEALELSELLAAFERASERMDVGLGDLTQEALDAPAPFSPSKNPNETVRSLLTSVFFHQAYHAGQAGILRRVAGKPGAIK